MTLWQSSEHANALVLIAGGLAQKAQEDTTQLTAALLLQQAAELATLAAIAQQLEEWTLTDILEELPETVWAQWVALRSYVSGDLEHAFGPIRDDSTQTFSELLTFFIDLYS